MSKQYYFIITTNTFRIPLLLTKFQFDSKRRKMTTEANKSITSLLYEYKHNDHVEVFSISFYVIIFVVDCRHCIINLLKVAVFLANFFESRLRLCCQSVGTCGFRLFSECWLIFFVQFIKHLSSNPRGIAKTSNDSKACVRFSYSKRGSELLLNVLRELCQS